jgi:hypothetical protein
VNTEAENQGNSVPAVNDFRKSKEISWIESGISGDKFALLSGQAFLREGRK